MDSFETLKLNKEFRRLYGRGKSLVHPLIVTYALKNKQGGIRIGVTVGKKVGGAVERNRAKRVIVAAFRQLAPRIDSGYDIVFVARARTGIAGSTAVAAVLSRQLRELGILKDETSSDSAD